MPSPFATVGAVPERIPARTRRIVATTLVILSGILAFASVYAIWADRQVSENRAWRDTAEALIQDPAIREVLAAELTDQLYAHVDVAAQVRRALPAQLSPLAAPAAGALREAIETGVDDALQRPAVQRQFVNAVGTAQSTAMAILDGEDPVAVTPDGTVTLDLKELLTGVADRVGFGALLADRLPPEAARIELIRSDDLKAAQTGLRVLRSLSIALPIITLLLVVAALWLAAGRRRETLRLLGIVLLVAAALVPIVRAMAGDMVIGAVDPAPAAQEAAERIWEIGTSLLDAGARSLLVYAIAILIAVFVAGPSRAAVALRRRLRSLTDPQWAYPLGALIVLAVLWWGPTQALRRWLPALILVVLLAVGLEALRRQIVREALAEGAPTGAPDVRRAVAGLGSDVSAGFRRLRGRPAPDRADQLERLARLKADGALTAEEYEAEKRRILGADAEG